jgi:chromosome segregation ATPase
MSLVFMGLSMAVYATHKNWKTANDALKKTLDQTRADKEKLATTQNLHIEELDRETKAAQQQAIKLESELQTQTNTNKQIQSELDTLKQNQRDQIAAVASTQALNQGLTSEVTELRGKVKDERQTRDRLFKQALDATEELHQANSEYENARERTGQLTKQVAGMTTVMREQGINPNTNPNAVVPTVEGVVSHIEQKAGGQLVEITIGADDGLKIGNTLEVFRGDKYLGRIDLIETSPDKSVGRVDRKFQQGYIQEGDRVATRIRF